jgi:hypothetical protein
MRFGAQPIARRRNVKVALQPLTLQVLEEIAAAGDTDVQTVIVVAINNSIENWHRAKARPSGIVRARPLDNLTDYERAHP